jgi:hypothetical protein
MGEPALAPSPIITHSYSQSEILLWIAALYTGGSFELDATYSTGGFYREEVPEPKLKFDLRPQVPGVQQADFRALPLDSASVTSAVFDPPFIHAAGQDSIIGRRFADGRSQHALRALYLGGLVEFYRVLKPKGVLVVKTQDIVESGRQVLNHCRVWEMANSLGFLDLDVFILLKRSSLRGHNWERQQHAHKSHSYFLVFEKGPRR